MIGGHTGMKKRERRTGRRAVSGVVVFALVLSSLVFLGQSQDDTLLKIYQGIDLFGKIYREVTLNYVDEVDPDQFIRAGIDGMLKQLDPYTVYYDEREQDEIDLVTNGRYGGIGVTIGKRDGAITIINLMEGYSAARQGLQVGDRILRINGVNVDSVSMDSIRELVRGVPGSEVRLQVDREGEHAPLDFVLIREEISIQNVSYAGLADSGIGYIKLDRFSRTAGEDVRVAVKNLEAKGPLRGIILDLRGNPGGLLDMAVDVAAKFLPESSLVVSTRGRDPGSERKYVTEEYPLVPHLPLAVLVNHSSASASEIVAGALQDLDRGVIVGTRTFGKGLVQTITRLSQNTSLKITTARYYTPSGRSIQAIDYAHRNEEGMPVVIPERDRKEYFTAHHRPVFSGAGILPDSVVSAERMSEFLEALTRKAMLFGFANHYARTHHELPPSFDVTDSILADFEAYLSQRKFEYQEEAEDLLAELAETAQQSRYGKEFLTHIARLKDLVQEEKTRAVSRYRDEVRESLREEIIGRVEGEKARIAASLPSDVQVQAAVGLLRDQRKYRTLLGGSLE